MTGNLKKQKGEKKSCFSLRNHRHLIISGPCSAESEEQLLTTARLLKEEGRVHLFRAGLWKPRTSPNSFTGYGEKAISWMQRVKVELQFPVCTEVALPSHVESCLKAGLRVFWLGARTVSNPFSVQEIADSLKGVDACVLVKNPLNPDMELWAGAVERLQKGGIEDLGLVHRGFYPFEITPLRNIPKWEIAIQMKVRFPGLPLICDVSHIAGSRPLLAGIAQKALDLNMDGLMIESHYQPGKALSDAGQQLSPEDLFRMLDRLVFRDADGAFEEYAARIEILRDQIDSIDEQIIDLLINRMKVAESIGAYKKAHNLAIVQVKRWGDILKSRKKQGKQGGLSVEFLDQLLQSIHEESIRRQSQLYNKKKD